MYKAFSFVINTVQLYARPALTDGMRHVVIHFRYKGSALIVFFGDIDMEIRGLILRNLQSIPIFRGDYIIATRERQQENLNIQRGRSTNEEMKTLAALVNEGGLHPNEAKPPASHFSRSHSFISAASSFRFISPRRGRLH